ncbi:hypothetical protein [Promicromonospora thailandica]|uniref:hypothetical protein n=1 Tax=Promicromonospora thailandica TaxID=765201 RepID=UPI00366F1025
MLATFIDHYVDSENPGDPRLDSLVRALVDERPTTDDLEALADLHRDPDASPAFSVYLRARTHYGAVVTLTEEGDLVLGLSLDDPLDDPDVAVRGAELIVELRNEFQAVAGLAGVELPPPQSASEWRDEVQVMLRDGEPP